MARSAGELRGEEANDARGAMGPRAMSRVLQLFSLLSAHREGMTLTRLSQALDVPKSTFLNSLRPLVSEGFLIADGPLYRLGPAAFRLAASIMSAFSLPEMIQTFVRSLAEVTRESVGLGVADWDSGRVVYIEAVQSTRPVLYAMRAGISAPLYASAAGRILLAHASEALREAYLDRKNFRPLTANTQTDPARLREQLNLIRAQGYCLSFGELLEETAAMAAPVFGADDQLLGALMIGAPIERMRANVDQFLAELLETSRRASGATA